MCTGACLASAAQHWGELGLGPTPREPPTAGLAPGAPVAPQPPRIRPPLLWLLYVCICICHEKCMQDFIKLQITKSQNKI